MWEVEEAPMAKSFKEMQTNCKALKYKYSNSLEIISNKLFLREEQAVLNKKEITQK